MLSVGIALRFAVSLLGSTYDLESYQIVGKLISQGKNIYAETPRYNYGPLWAFVLGFFRVVSQWAINANFYFRLFIIAALTISDIAIFFWLKRWYSKTAAMWFFLNPISIYITGFTNQFDTVAIALALYSILFFMQQKGRIKIVGLLLLGISIAVKHLFIFYPMWLFFSTTKTKNNAYLTIPYFIFACSFIPFLFAPHALDGIWNNVITYKKSVGLYPFLPSGIFRPLLMIVPMGIAAYVFRKVKPSAQVLLYLLLLIAISPIVAGQYFTIPLSAFSALSIPTGVLFTLISLWALFYSNQTFATVAIIGFAVCWLPLIFYFIKKQIPLLKGGVILFSTILFFLLSAQTYKKTGAYIQEQKAEFFILKVLHPAAQVFPTENNKTRQHIVTGIVLEGNFTALTDNIGFITVPFFLQNPSPEFFKKKYTVTVQAFDVTEPTVIYSEKRDIAGGLSLDGLILGLPLLPHSAGKEFHVRVSSTIPEGVDFITIDPFAFVQSRYFLTKSEITDARFILKFISNKLYYLLSLKNTGELLFYYYSTLWGIALLGVLLKKREGFTAY